MKVFPAVLIFFKQTVVLVLATSFTVTPILANQSESKPIELTSDSPIPSSKLMPLVAYYFEPRDGLDVADALEKFRLGKLQHQSQATINFGYTAGTMWLVLPFHNIQDHHAHFILRYNYPSMQYIDFWLLDADQNILSQYNTGKSRHVSSRPIAYRSWLFPVELAPLQQGYIVMALQTIGSLQATLSLETPASVNNIIQTEYLAMGIYYGFVILMLIYSLWTYIMIKDRNYLYYAAYILAVTLTQASLHGLTYQYLWPSAEWTMPMTVIFVGLTILTLSVFSASFLNTRKNIPIGHFMIIAYAAAAVILILWAMLNYSNPVIRFAGILTALLPAVFLAVACLSVRRGVPSSVFYFLAIVLYSIGACLYGAKDLGLIPANFLAENGIVIGSAVEVALFSLGLSYKMKFIEEQRRQFELASQRDRAMALTTQMMAHDVRKPFSLINAGLERLDTINDISTLRQTVATLRTSLGRSMSTANEIIRDVASIDKRHGLEKKHFNLSNSLLQLVDEQKTLDARKSIHWQVYIYPELKVFADEKELKRAFSNVLQNAVDAVNDGGRVTVRAEFLKGADMKGATISITNSGSSIDPNQRQKIFEPFFSEGKVNGTGLGCAIAQRIITGHGGEITVTSDPTKGTTFTFWLPFTSTSTYVLLEDDVFIRENWTESARKAGLSLLCFATSQELLAARTSLCKKSDFYLDQELEGDPLTGLDVAKILRKSGFNGIYLSTDHNAQAFTLEDLSSVNGVVSKQPPWACFS